MQKLISIIIAVTALLVTSCQETEYYIEETHSNKVEIQDGQIKSPLWLYSKIQNAINVSDGVSPWLFTTTLSGQEYLSLLSPSNGDTKHFTLDGEMITDSVIINKICNSNSELLWRDKKQTPKTRAVINTPIAIYTPYGSLVPNTYTRTEEYTNSINNISLMEDLERQYVNSEAIGQPSTTYNCHGYAWSMNGSSYSPVWIGWDQSGSGSTVLPEDSEDIYWEDNSYILSTEANGRIVSYRYDDHSAIATSTHDVYISKWGKLALMRHNRYYCPYYGSSVKFYKRNPKPAYYIGQNETDYGAGSTYLSLSGGYAGTTLHAYTATRNTITRYQWNAQFYGECDSWYIWPSSSNADISIYSSGNNEGGTLRVTCSMYNGSNLLATTSYYIYIAQ